MDAEALRIMSNEVSSIQSALRNVRLPTPKESEHARLVLCETNSRAITDALSFVERYAPKGSLHTRILDEHKGALDDTRARTLLGIIQSMHKELTTGAPNMSKSDIPAFRLIDKMLNRFHKVAKRLKDRHANRDGFWINDEYDVQDLLNALLLVDFDDIREEEWTPSYAGGSKRMDFVLKKERIVIEVKITRDGRADRQIGDELCVDIPHYKEHGDCQTLIGFIYDPEQTIKNAAGLKFDLERQSTDTFTVVIVVAPPH